VVTPMTFVSQTPSLIPAAIFLWRADVAFWPMLSKNAMA
jgi:hypothetical protein